MDSWLYDENAPFLHIEVLGVYDYLRKQLDTDYFEQLIQKYLLDNTHVSYVRSGSRTDRKKGAGFKRKIPGL
ncbi:MAG: hypothetical protein V8R46_03205 [Eubacterium ramulus]